MRTIITTLLLSYAMYAHTQDNTLWLLKDESFFNRQRSGHYSGQTNGFLEVINGHDTIQLDLHNTSTNLDIEPEAEEVYDVSYKKYTTHTTSGKTSVSYTFYNLANVLEITLNGIKYSVGSMDGAADGVIHGLSFKYSHDGNREYLVLYADQTIELTNVNQLMQKKNMDYTQASQKAKKIGLRKGSCLMITIGR